MSKPDGREERLLNRPRYDFNWQRTYRYSQAIALPKGTVLTVVAHHDNSAANPNQQFDPPRDIFSGEATDVEMAFMSLAYTLDDQDLERSSRSRRPRPLAATATASLRR